jgi:DNA-binding CsgD family transcriptional regulator
MARPAALKSLLETPSHDLLDDLRRSPNPAYATDESNRIVAWNRGAERLLGRPAEEALDRECHTLLAGTDIFGNTLCDRECSVLKMVRRNQVVKRFDMNLSHAASHAVRVHCAILVVPDGSRSRLFIVHVLEEADQDPERWTSRRTNTPPGRPLPRPTDPHPRLTRREEEVLRLISDGAGTREIADTLSISLNTVRTHVRNLLHKMHARSRLEAVVRALQTGLL